MKILVLIQYWYPYESALQPIYGAIFEDLISKGYEITILTSFPHYRKGRNEDWREYRWKFRETGLWNGATVIRTFVFAPRFSSAKLGVLMRALTFVSFYLSSFVAALMLPKHDLIFVSSAPPLIGAVSAGMLGRLRGTPYVFNVQDIFPDNAVRAGIIKNPFLIRFLDKLEKFVYRRASHITVLSETMKAWVSSRGGGEKVSVVPNFCDTDFVRPVSKYNEFSVRHGFDRRFVVMFAGNIGLVQSVEHIISAAEILRGYQDIVFVFVGAGENRHGMEELAKNKALPNVLFIDRQPFSEMPNIWGSADIGLVTLLRGIAQSAVPSKTFGIMAAGRPVLAMVDEGSEAWDIVDRAQCGICVPPESPRLLAEAVLRLYKDPEERKKMGASAREYVVANYHRSVISGKYEELFCRVVRGNGL